MQKEKTNAIIKTVLWVLATVVAVILLPAFLLVGAAGLLLIVFGVKYADIFRWVVDKVRLNASTVRQDKNEQDEEELHTEE